MDLQALAVRRDAPARAQFEGGVHQIVRRYCRALIGRSGRDFARADALADDLARTILCERRDEFGGAMPAEAIVYSGMVAVVARAVHDRPVPPPPEPHGLVSPEHVQEQLRRLPPRSREVLVLRAFVGMSCEQAGRALGLTPQVVRQEQRQALASLRSL
jgi:RNA polymerase sigma-70 factor (ECF subfamily)